MGISFESPYVQPLHYRFEPISTPAFVTGLGAFKGPASRRLPPSSRHAKPAGRSFHCSTSVCASTDEDEQRTVEALIKAGAFDNLQLNRASLCAS